MVHERFDKLAGVARDQRSRSDMITDDVFDRVKAMLTESGWQDVAEFGNKFIATPPTSIRPHLVGGFLRAVGFFQKSSVSWPFARETQGMKRLTRAAGPSTASRWIGSPSR